MDSSLDTAILNAFTWCTANGVEIPLDIYLGALQAGAVKADPDLAAIQARYHDRITEALTMFFESGKRTINRFKQAAVEALGGAFDLGYKDGGGALPVDPDALTWLNGRIEQEFGFIQQIYVQAKEIKKDPEADWFAWVTERADGYTRTIQDLYSMGKVYAAGNKMLTFDGEDGQPDNICQRNQGTCVKLKGKRHKAKWWISHGLVPYRGNPAYDCGAWECQHYLRDDQGNRVTL